MRWSTESSIDCGADATSGLAERFRAGLAAIDVDEEATAAIVAEAPLSFTLHHRRFEDFAAGRRGLA
jgi:hypothetical protein